MFSHGSGWLPPHTLVNGSRSIIIDNDNEMEITDFAMALPDHLFEFIIFEACNMAGIEVAYELRNKAAYIMASSAPVVSPGFTPIYAGSISCLLEEAADLQRFAENYFHYWNLMEGDKRSATISIIKTAGLSNLANLIRQINTEISGSFLPIGNLQNYDGVLKAPFYFLISLNVINHYQMKTHTMHFKSVSANVWFTKEILHFMLRKKEHSLSQHFQV